MREENGFPHIFSASYLGSLYGLGYVHCQDRLFSMLLKRLVLQGRMSEYLGPDLIPLDTYFLKLGLNSISQQNYLHLQDKDKEYLEYYAQGVNECAVHRNSWPWEMTLLGIQWEEWKPVNSISVMKLIAFLLSFDYKYEILREKLAEKLGEEKARIMMGGLFQEEQFERGGDTIINKEEIQEMGLGLELDPRLVVGRLNRTLFQETRPDNQTVQSSEEEQTKHDKKISSVVQSMYELMGQMTTGVKGSNNWVIRGEHTSTGGVLMASDPHLDNGIPTVWHLSEINYLDEQGQEAYVAGVTMAGMPIFAIGRNNHIAFAVTVLFNDNSDSYLETVDHVRNTYLFEGQWLPLEVETYYLKVKGQQERIPVTRKATRKGPLMDKVIGGRDKHFNHLPEDISIAWSGFAAVDDRFPFLIEYSKIHDLDSFLHSLGQVRDINLNFLVGTDTNQIAYYPVGAHPIKKYKDGGFYKDGSSREQEWTGYLDYNNQTKLVQPKRGWIATANNKNMPDDSYPASTFGHPSTSRAKRVHQMILQLINRNKRTQQKVTVKDMMTMQQDVKDSYMSEHLEVWTRLLQKVMKESTHWSTEQKQLIEKTIEQFRVWDFKVTKDSWVAAVLTQWELLYSQSMTQVLQNEGQFQDMVVGSFTFHEFMFEYLLRSEQHFNQPHNWNWADSLCGSTHCLDAFVDTLLAALHSLHQQQVTQYGQIHEMFYPHQIASKIPILSSIFNRQFQSDGNSRTVFAAMNDYESNVTSGFHSSNLRMVFDLKGDSYYILDIGQSENYFSPNYDDMFIPFQNNHYYKLYTGRKHQYTDKYLYRIQVNSHLKH